MIATLLIVLLIGSTLLLVTAAIVISLMPKSSAATRFSIWQISVTSMLLLPVGIFLLPEVSLGLVFNTPTVTSLSPRPSVMGSQPSIPTSFPSDSKPVKPVGLQANSTPIEIESSTTIASSKMPLDATSTATLPAAVPFSSDGWQAIAQITQTALLIWLAIALALLIRTLLAHLRVALPSRSGDCEFDPDRIECFNWLPDSVEVTYSERQNVPVTLGIWRRRIILPAIADEWSTDQLRMVLKHELAHVLRRDVLWQFITSIAISIFWFQPLAWLAARQLKLEREQACDDQVIAGGEHAADYASVLVQLAATFSGRKSIPTGALSMTQKPIELRLANILSPSTIRTPTSRWLCRLAATIALLVVAGVCSIRPFAPLAVAMPQTAPLLSSFQDSESDDLDFPRQLTGLVVDEYNEPVAGAELQLTATPRPKTEAYQFHYTHATVHLPVVKTDEEGKYLVNISELENGQDIWSIHGKVVVENRPHAPFSRTVRKGVKPDLKIRKIHLQPGKVINGRVIPPTSSTGIKLENPVITVRPIGSLPSHKWLGETVKCKSDGRFSVMVARDVRVSIQATADNFAGTGLEVQPKVRDLNDIPLQAGTKVKGKLLDREGRPVAGVFVHSDTENKSYNFRNGSNANFKYEPHFSRHCKTNVNGEFELQPQVGKIRVSLRPVMYDFDSHKKTASDRVPPVVIPLQIDLNKFDTVCSIKLQEAKTVRASGKIRWPDGSPAIGLDAQVHLMTGPSSIQVYSTKTDENGIYTALLPENTRSSVFVSGARNVANQWLYAKASTNSDKAFQQSTQRLGLLPLTGDTTGLDWKLSLPDASGLSKATADARELKHLMYGPRSPDEEEIRIRIAAELNEQDKQKLREIYERQQQQRVAKLVAFEQKHRGEFLGAVALANYIDLEQPEQLDEFAANYITSPNADAVICDIYYQGNLAHTRKILQTFAKDSPHANIQATALFFEAGVIAMALQNREYFKKAEWRPTWPKSATDEEAGVAKYNQLMDELMSCDTEQLLADFDLILAKLKTQYAEHGSTIVNWGGARLKERRTKPVKETYAEWLQQHRFQLEKLNSGQPLPHLIGRDVYGVDFDSERLKGKTVLLFFTSNLYADRPNFEKLRELRKRYEGRPFEIVSVMVDSKPEDAKAAVDNGKITWATLYDVDQKLMKQWQFDPCSDRLLIDHQGTIQRRAMYGTDLEETIEQLVRNAERN